MKANVLEVQKQSSRGILIKGVMAASGSFYSIEGFVSFSY